ncbi:hypothetical protein F5Y11DRAFT_7300 [Daldinia sp. FL1419]|nr:hypothetical protein F5Y11DRAFT_7300 [Daldinia sp. FL1419]
MASAPPPPEVPPKSYSLSGDDGSDSLDESDTFDEPNTFDEPYRTTFKSVYRGTSIKVPIISIYAPHWGPAEAFRELLQNWRDGIVKSFGIAEDSFRVIRKEEIDTIVYVAFGARHSKKRKTEISECLGYIRWFRRGEVGTVEVVNRNATLQPWHLDMGVISKQGDTRQAGERGEGLKIALLVLLRRPQNHAVRCYSGGCSWIFDFTGRQRLTAKITPMRRDEIEKVHTQTSNDVKNARIPITVSPEEDVQFFIGGEGIGWDRNRGPRMVKNQVSKRQFKRWTKSALFLQSFSTGEIVRTGKGDLILDDRFCGSIYLKGLLLKEFNNDESASITGKKLRYGYNFADGVVNREKVFVADAWYESTAILDIWGSAFRLQSNLVEKFHELLNSDQPEYADVSQAEYHVTSDMTSHIKTYLLEEFKDRWLYSAKERIQNTRFDEIVYGLGRKPLEISESYWTILKSCGFRTAEEEATNRFSEGEVIDIPETGFAKSVAQLIRASLGSCTQTASADVIFVKAGSVGLDSFYSYSQNLFKVHGKWLTIKGAKDELGISTKITEASLLFNITRHLFTDAVNQVPLMLFREDGRSRYWYRQQAINQGDQRILEHTQVKQDLRFTVKEDDDSGTLVAQWNPNTGWLPETSIRIYFHCLSTCSHLLDCHTTKRVLSRTSCFNQRGNRPSSCKMVETSFTSGSCESRVARGERYFMIMLNPSDGCSFPIYSDKPSSKQDTPESNVTRNNTQTFALKDPIESPDITTPRSWSTSASPTGIKAVIGIEKGGTVRVTPPLNSTSTPTCNWERGDCSGDEASRRVRRRLF